MPKWGWWVAAFVLFMYWSSYSHFMVRGYWFSGWWKTVMYRPLGEWRLIDVSVFIGVYVAVHLIAQTIAFFRELEVEETSREKSEPKEK